MIESNIDLKLIDKDIELKYFDISSNILEYLLISIIKSKSLSNNFQNDSQ